MSKAARPGDDRSYGSRAVMPLAILGVVNLLLIPRVVANGGSDALSMISVFGWEMTRTTLFTGITLVIIGAGYLAIGTTDFAWSRRSSSPMTTMPLLVVGVVGVTIQSWMFMTDRGMLVVTQWFTYLLNFKSYGLLTIACSITVLAFWRHSRKLLAVAGIYILSIAPSSYAGLVGGRTASSWIEYAVPAGVLLISALALSPATSRLISWRTLWNREVKTT